MTEKVTNSTYQVKSGDTTWKLIKESGLTLNEFKTLNPKVNPDNIKIGQQLLLHKPQTTEHEYSVDRITYKTSPTEKTSEKVTKPNKTSSGMTLSQYESSLPQAVKIMKPTTKKAEGKVANTYIEPNGKTAIGYGHFLKNKPAFLTAIEKEFINRDNKDKKLKQALLNPKNAIALKNSIEKELSEAIKITGIKDVPSTINKDLKLTDNQIEVLLNADIKKAQQAMEKDIGKKNLEKCTSNQKAVLLDLYFNIGENLKSKAPNLIKYVKEGKMDKAQAEIDLCSCNGKILKGLINRNYERMLLFNDNKGLSKEAQNKLLTLHNKYCMENGKKIALTFVQAEKSIKA